MNPAFLAESGVLPDALVRSGIRRRLMGILKDMEAKEGSLAESKARFAADLRQGPATIEQDRANRQHYELPPEFFESFLGYRRKYSCCYWHDGVGDLDAAEDAMLEMTASRAGIEPGQTILDLGCGWGSFSLWAAEKFPGIKIHALSNSSAQIDYILREASQRGFSNITAERADITCYSTEELYDRVVSVEMVEHIRDWGGLLARISGWLTPEGKCFLHFFCHRNTPYLYKDRDPSDWMGYYFFAGGMMPSYDLPRYYQEDLRVEKNWPVNGRHYVKTLEAWLKKMDGNRSRIRPILQETYGKDRRVWENRWRIFLMACSELFGTYGGGEWFVAHYLLSKKSREPDPLTMHNGRS